MIKINIKYTNIQYNVGGVPRSEDLILSESWGRIVVRIQSLPRTWCGGVETGA